MNKHSKPTLPIDDRPLDTRLPIKLDSTSNGEFMPIPLTERENKINQLALQQADQAARRTGRSRRDFLASSCGAAATLLAFNQAHAFGNGTEPAFNIPADAAFDPELAASKLDGQEFIFDIQGHYLPPDLARTLKPKCRAEHDMLSPGYMSCMGADDFIKDVFLDSDTDLMALSFIPSTLENEPLSIEEAAKTREMVDQLGSSQRLLLHGRCNPNQPGDLNLMDELAEKWKVAAFKCYTQYGPGGKGFFLSDSDTGIPYIEKARKLGVHNICVHKGFPFGKESYEHSLCDDIGKVAKLYPDMNFMIYHSGYVPGQAEGAYDPDHNEGIDSLVRSVMENDVAPNSNVYAELGSTWRFASMRDPQSAAHVLGKLFKYIGENNVLWGTDSVWYGSPQDQIQAFRVFQIPAELRETHGYPEITPQLRAKVFGLNATVPYRISVDEVLRSASRDSLAHQRAEYRNHAQPHFATYGPKTRREFLKLMNMNGGKMT